MNIDQLHTEKVNQIDFDLVPSPCYLIDERRLIRNVKILNFVAERSGVSILCALKGYACYPTFSLLKKYLNGATASSIHEAKLTIEEWGKKPHLCFPAYDPIDSDFLFEHASHITFNSLSQWELFKGVAHKHPDVECAIRINPEYSEIETSIYDPSGKNSRLGVKRQHMPTKLPKGINGLHVHAMCEQDSFALERMLQKIEERFAPFLKEIKWINLGGGHHITRYGYDVNHLIELLKNFKAKYDIEIILEPGEAVVWEAGYLVSSVLDIIEETPVPTAMLNTSFAAHMPDCLEMPYKPHVVGAIIENDFFATYQLGGATCLAGDQIGNYSFVDKLKPGDKIVFHDMAHYTMVKNTTFNGVSLPAIGIWTVNEEFKLFKEFGYNDFKNRLG